MLDAELEFKRRGNFKLIFPCKNANIPGSVFKSLFDKKLA